MRGCDSVWQPTRKSHSRVTNEMRPMLPVHQEVAGGILPKEEELLGH